LLNADTPANVQVSGGEESKSADGAVCGVKKLTYPVPLISSKMTPMLTMLNRKMINLLNGKLYFERWCHKIGNSPDAQFKPEEFFVPRLKPDTRFVCLKRRFGYKFEHLGFVLVINDWCFNYSLLFWTNLTEDNFLSHAFVLLPQSDVQEHSCKLSMEALMNFASHWISVNALLPNSRDLPLVKQLDAFF